MSPTRSADALSGRLRSTRLDDVFLANARGSLRKPLLAWVSTAPSATASRSDVVSACIGRLSGRCAETKNRCRGVLRGPRPSE